ncbi:MAG: hypothetical protein IPF68_13140 [Bacteroidales bacterium]|nr:hypothetical protein [Bacteroidales bacterium]
MKFSPDNNFILSGSDDKTMILWDLQKYVNVFTYRGHLKRINSGFQPGCKVSGKWRR